MRNARTRCGAASVCVASQGAKTYKAKATAVPVQLATTVDRASILPVRSGSRSRSSAVCFVAVSPNPNPPNTVNRSTLLLTIPSSP